MCVCTCVDQCAWCVLFLQRCKTFGGIFLFDFFSTFGFIESSEVLLATCSLLNNFCGSSDFIYLQSISYLLEVVVPHLRQCPTHVSGRTLN